MLRTIFIILLACCILPFAHAAEKSPPLPADQAFAFSAYLNQNNQLILEWNIAPGYYLYRNQLKLIPSPLNQVKIAPIQLPKGQFKHDVLHGNYQAYMGSLKIPVTFIASKKGLLHLNIDYQGCSSAGFCYTPIKKSLKVDLSEVSASQNLTQYVKTINDVHISEQAILCRIF